MPTKTYHVLCKDFAISIEKLELLIMPFSTLFLLIGATMWNVMLKLLEDWHGLAQKLFLGCSSNKTLHYCQHHRQSNHGLGTVVQWHKPSPLNQDTMKPGPSYKPAIYTEKMASTKGMNPKSISRHVIGQCLHWLKVETIHLMQYINLRKKLIVITNNNL